MSVLCLMDNPLVCIIINAMSGMWARLYYKYCIIIIMAWNMLSRADIISINHKPLGYINCNIILRIDIILCVQHNIISPFNI